MRSCFQSLVGLSCQSLMGLSCQSLVGSCSQSWPYFSMVQLRSEGSDVLMIIVIIIEVSRAPSLGKHKVGCYEHYVIQSKNKVQDL